MNEKLAGAPFISRGHAPGGPRHFCGTISAASQKSYDKGPGPASEARSCSPPPCCCGGDAVSVAYNRQKAGTGAGKKHGSNTQHECDDDRRGELGADEKGTSHDRDRMQRVQSKAYSVSLSLVYMCMCEGVKPVVRGERQGKKARKCGFLLLPMMRMRMRMLSKPVCAFV